MLAGLADSPRSACSGSLLHCASALHDRHFCRRFDELRGSTGGRLSVCFDERPSRQPPPPLASPNHRSSTGHPKMPASNRRLSTSRVQTRASTDKLGSAGSLPAFCFTSSCPRQHVLRETAFEKYALHRQLKQLTASTSHARPMQAEYLVGESGPRAGSLRDTGTSAGAQKIGRSTIVQRARSHSRSCVPAPPEGLIGSRS